MAIIFDALQEIIFRGMYDRLIPIISSYRESFGEQQIDDEMNNIVQNNSYKILCDSTNYPFISLLLHIELR